MTLADLEAYQPVTRAPIEGTYRGYRIKSMAPPSSGALTVIQILKMLERFPLGDASQGFGFGSLKTVNVMADAMRIAFADRSAWLGDADFVPVPVAGEPALRFRVNASDFATLAQPEGEPDDGRFLHDLVVVGDPDIADEVHGSLEGIDVVRTRRILRRALRMAQREAARG